MPFAMCHHCGSLFTIYLFNMYVLSAHLGPGVVIGADNTEGNEMCPGPALSDLPL